MGCIVGNGITICFTDLEKEIVGKTKKKWCFKCRKHIVHNKVLLTEKEKYDEKGHLIGGYWFEPTLKYECRGCGEEHLRIER